MKQSGTSQESAVYLKTGLFGCHGNGYCKSTEEILLRFSFQAPNVNVYTEEKKQGRKKKEKIK
jgi:hypothetical protein